MNPDTIQINILGVGSASPTRRHNPSAQVLTYRGAGYMIDCGEGAQQQMVRMGISPHSIRHVFLSHLHGDHCLGLVPLLSTMSLNQVGGSVTIHTFAEGERIFRDMVSFFCGETTFEINYNIINPFGHQLLVDEKGLTVESFPLYHRVHAVGFRVSEKPKPRHLRADMLDFWKVPVFKRNDLKMGVDFVTPDGTVVPNGRLTTDPSPSVSYAYCSDTIFSRRVARAVEGVDLLYHEATYADVDRHKAAPRGHSTARQAAEVAHLAGAKRLLLGHFSKSSDENQLLAEAREVFPETILAQEGMKIDV